MSFIMTNVYSQNYDFTVTKIKSAIYNSYTEKYNDNENIEYPLEMHIYYINGVFAITDEARSNYRVVHIIKENDQGCMSYTATDERNRETLLILCASEGEGALTVIYMKKYYLTYYIK